jgi:hypothetical protein
MRLVRSSLIVFSLITLLLAGCAKETAVTVTVNAGSDLFVQLPADTVNLSGTVTSGQTTNVSFLWSPVTGPNTPTIANNNFASCFINNLVAGTYVFQFQAICNGTTATDTVTVIVLPLRTKTITIQPGLYTGQDAEAGYTPGLYDGNGASGTDPWLRIVDWTWYAVGAGEGWSRSFVKFTALDTLPANAVILSAKLSLYALSDSLTIYSGFPGDSYYPGSPYNGSGPNPLWLQRCTQNWDQTTLTWNNQPTTTTTDEVAVPASTSQFSYNVTDLDVTQLIRDMKATPGTNYGFLMRLQNEQFYNSMNFDASEAKPDSSTGPKLVVTYQY